MTDRIRFNVHVAIKEGRLEDFKGIARDWSAYHLETRPDILSYEWYFREAAPGNAPTEAVVLEVYESSEAMLATMGDVAEAEAVEEPDYPYDMIRIEVCGNVSAALRARLDAGKSTIEYFSHIGGYTR